MDDEQETESGCAVTVQRAVTKYFLPFIFSICQPIDKRWVRGCKARFASGSDDLVQKFLRRYAEYLKLHCLD